MGIRINDSSIYRIDYSMIYSNRIARVLLSPISRVDAAIVVLLREPNNFVLERRLQVADDVILNCNSAYVLLDNGHYDANKMLLNS